jgi:transcriptional regulator with XRE-family HTH domain
MSILNFTKEIGDCVRATSDNAVAPFMPICITLERHATVGLSVTDFPWIGAIRRHLAAKLRPDPRSRLHAKFWTQADLAEEADIRTQTLSRILQGKTQPDMPTLSAIADALGVDRFRLLMSDEQEHTFDSAAQHAKQESAQEIAIRQAREHIISRVDAALADVFKPAEAPLAIAPATAGKKKR